MNVEEVSDTLLTYLALADALSTLRVHQAELFFLETVSVIEGTLAMAIGELKPADARKATEIWAEVIGNRG